MKFSRRSITKSLIAAAAVSSVPFAWAADVVKIGYVSPQTGPLAPFGEADKWVIEQMKVAFKDGITIGGKKHEVQIILKEPQPRW
jgi:branched-chain amino acid transport system substrate-binding protein